MKRKRADPDRGKQSASTRTSTAGRDGSAGAVRSNPLESLHGTVGNGAVGALLERHDEAGAVVQRRAADRTIQRRGDGSGAGLEMTTPGDAAEREAERVADEVVRPAGGAAPGRTGSDPGDRSATSDPRERIGGAARSRTDAPDVVPETDTRGVDPHLEDRLTGLGGGRRLPDDLRAEFEREFGRDLGDVRLHTGRRADEAARSIGAEAYTVGRDVAFAAGNYRPETERGRRLLAHELAHVIQQRRGPERVQPYMGEDPFEREDDDRRTRQEQAEYYTAPPGAAVPDEEVLLELLGGLQEAARLVIEGVTSFPEQLWYAGQRWFESVNLTDVNRVQQIHDERKRAMALVGKFVTASKYGAGASGPFYTFTKFLLQPLVREVVAETLTEDEKAQLEAAVREEVREVRTTKSREMLGKFVGNTLITKRLIRELAAYILKTSAVSEFTRRVASASVRLGPLSINVPMLVVSLYVFGSSTLQRASLASQRLQKQYPAAHRELKARDLDLLYFLVEDHVEELKRMIAERIREYVQEELARAAVKRQLEELGHGMLGRGTIHVVERGDTLTDIAEQYGVSVAALERANDVDPRNLQIDEPIFVPDAR